jgi:hypothetical protein
MRARFAAGLQSDPVAFVPDRVPQDFELAEQAAGNCHHQERQVQAEVKVNHLAPMTGVKESYPSGLRCWRKFP